jgi:GNAT superfamily N-acetyltransferase
VSEVPLLDHIKPLAARVLGDYEIYWIFCWEGGSTPAPGSSPGECEVTEIDTQCVDALPAAALRERAWYAGEGARIFLATWRGNPAGVCFYWFGARYRARNFWPLQPGEAKLVEIVVDPDYRRRGIAAHLIAVSARRLCTSGFDRLYARVWHSNTASIAAFRHAGWRRIALVFTAMPLGMRRRVRTVLPWRER